MTELGVMEIFAADLVPVDSPPLEPRLRLPGEPRRVNLLTLIDGKTFLATTLSGDITPAGSTDVGLFYQDTRFLSHLELRVNQHRGVVLSAAAQQNILTQIELTTTSNLLLRDNLDLPENTVHIHREQLLVETTLFDRFQFQNFNLRPVELEIEICLAADFVDVFQVRGFHRRHAGTWYQPIARPGALTFCYCGLDHVFRSTSIRFEPAPNRLTANAAFWTLQLEPHQQRNLALAVQPAAIAGRGHPLPLPALTPSLDTRFHQGLASRRQAFGEWQSDTTWLDSSDDRFNHCLQSAVGDFFSLRIGDSTHPAPRARAVPEGGAIAAGIPWFATVFGRDSLIAAFQSLLLQPRLAADTLRFLAARQGSARDDWRDEQPGKILHELREGEMTRAGEMPHSPYYGSVDATPLWIVLLDEIYRWTGDRALIDELLPAAFRALAWIETDADLDGDGFLEFLRRSPQGLSFQGWKDSWDSALDRRGNLPAPPLALSEVQGYAYDARVRFARLLEALGDAAAASRLRAQAAALARNFDAVFWIPSENAYALLLDAEKHPQPAIASNLGHLLWSRIVPPAKAAHLAQRLLQPDLFSGWGIRTLAASEPTFNPMSYHRGSVWPHDNSIIAQGLAFYGFKPAMLSIFDGLFDAAQYFRDNRLPELFVGTQRSHGDQPVHYPVSCSPQAWASGAWFLLLTAALGLRPDAPRHELRIITPTLPPWLSWLRLHRLHIGESEVTLEFNRRNHRTTCNVVEIHGERLSVTVDFSMPTVDP